MLSRKHAFVVTNGVSHKHVFVATKVSLSRQTFVVTKMILVAAPTNDTCNLLWHRICDLCVKFVLAGLTEILKVWSVWIMNCIFQYDMFASNIITFVPLTFVYENQLCLSQ